MGRIIYLLWTALPRMSSDAFRDQRHGVSLGVIGGYETPKVGAGN